MAKINLPKNLLEGGALKSLPAKDKEEYITNLLKKILDLNQEGITISQVREAINLPSSTIWHHLEILKSSMQSRKISRGNIDIYYPLGKMYHIKDYDMGKVIYTVNNVENSEGKFICIHEKRKNSLGSYTILRGISIPVGLINEILLTLSKARKLVKKED